MNFTWDAMESSQVSYRRLLEGALAHKNGDNAAEPAAQDALKAFFEAIGDDLNVPKALGVLWVLVKNPHKSREIYDALVKMDAILALDIDKCAEKCDNNADAQPDIPQEALELLQKRSEARRNKNWAESDRLRDLLGEMGYSVVDTKEGAKLVRR